METGECPAWLEVLLNDKFSDACLEHEGVKKNEKNILCIDCCLSICPHCLPSHAAHRLLQIRRYVYNDVLRVDDGSKLMDCSLIQPYITNSCKVVFIKETPHSRRFSDSDNFFCNTCDRSLQSPYTFCSLSCKISDVIMRQRGGLSGFLRVCKFLRLTDDGATSTASSTNEPTGLTRTSSESGGVRRCQTLACTPTSEIVGKKRSSLATATAISEHSGFRARAELFWQQQKHNKNPKPDKNLPFVGGSGEQDMEADGFKQVQPKKKNKYKLEMSDHDFVNIFVDLETLYFLNPASARGFRTYMENFLAAISSRDGRQYKCGQITAYMIEEDTPVRQVLTDILLEEGIVIANYKKRLLRCLWCRGEERIQRKGEKPKLLEIEMLVHVEGEALRLQKTGEGKTLIMLSNDPFFRGKVRSDLQDDINGGFEVVMELPSGLLERPLYGPIQNWTRCCEFCRCGTSNTSCTRC